MGHNKHKDRFIPNELLQAHDLCFVNHDILVELLRSGEEQRVFWEKYQFRDENDRKALEQASDIFDWLEVTGRVKERALLLRRVVFPALLSDFLHFIYEALDCSRKAKLNVAYALLRKPLQENLFVFEVIAADVDKFSNLLASNPQQLYSQTAGGLEVHTDRIKKVLKILDEDHRFDANYLAQLRYDKNADDGFDGITNKAIHLFTGHRAIQTEPLNINFIFSDIEAKISQWHYLYSRLPYILFYSRRLIEYICSTLMKTDPIYLADIERRVAASTILWANQFNENYRQPSIEKFINETRTWLYAQCAVSGFREPATKDLIRMQRNGAYPGESVFKPFLRKKRYDLLSRQRIKQVKQ